MTINIGDIVGRGPDWKWDNQVSTCKKRILGECLLRQGFENACRHREACRAIQHAFSKSSLVNLMSKETNLVQCILFIRLPVVSLLKLAIMT